LYRGDLKPLETTSVRDALENFMKRLDGLANRGERDCQKLMKEIFSSWIRAIDSQLLYGQKAAVIFKLEELVNGW
jgi:hypothetical protein